MPGLARKVVKPTGKCPPAQGPTNGGGSSVRATTDSEGPMRQRARVYCDGTNGLYWNQPGVPKPVELSHEED